MANIHIPIEHQSAPSLRYDPVLAREAALVEDPSAASRRDWDKFDWEMHTPEHDDPGIALLRRIENDPNAWVEENLELYEANRENSKQQQLPDQERWEGKEQEEQRLVNILHPSQVMRKLRMAGVDARDEEHPHARIWLNDWTRKGLVGVNAWVAPVEMDREGFLLELSYATTQRTKDILTANFHACLNHRKVIRTITTLQDPYGPEWSLMRFNEYGVATKEKFRGWRTAMLVLIVAEILTEDEVDRAFGPPVGPASTWYRAQLQAYRQIRLGKAI